MKTFLCAALAAFVVYASPTAKAQSAIPEATIKITPLIGPYVRTQEFLDNTVNGITGTDSPATPIPIVNDTINISSIVCTPTFYSWQGSVTSATGLFATQYGNRLIFSYDIRSSQPFNPFDVVAVITSPFFTFSNTFGSSGLTYDLRAIGEAADGTIYTTGSMGQQSVVRLRGTGNTYTINVGGSGQADIDEALSTWSPFDVTVTYMIGGSSSSSTVHIGVPEPSSLSIILVGIGAMIARRRT